MASPYKAFDAIVERTPEVRDIGQRVWNMALQFLHEGKLKTTPLDVREGLEGALQGMDDLRKGNISGKKIVSQLL